MKRLIAMMVGTSLMCSAPLLAQDKKAEKPKDMPKMSEPAKGDTKGEPSMEDMMKMMEESSKLGPYHKWLGDFAGEWKTTVKMFGPDGKPMSEDHGTMEYTSEMDGRYVEVDFKGVFMGKPFTGSGTMAYNNLEKRFESTWFDSMSTGIMYSTGQADKDGKVLTMWGEGMMPDGTKCKSKEVTTVVSKDEHRGEFFNVVDGKEMKTMEITYVRAKGEGKKEAKAEKKDEKHEAKKDEKKAK